MQYSFWGEIEKKLNAQQWENEQTYVYTMLFYIAMIINKLIFIVIKSL